MSGVLVADFSGSWPAKDAGRPSGPVSTTAGGFAMAERFELDPVVKSLTTPEEDDRG
jgi:hypothetical protein